MLSYTIFRAAKWVAALSISAALACAGDTATATAPGDPVDPGNAGNPVPATECPASTSAPG